MYKMLFSVMAAVTMMGGAAQAAEQLTTEQLDTVTAGKYVNYASVHAGSHATAQAHGNQASGSVYTGNGVSTSSSSSSNR